MTHDNRIHLPPEHRIHLSPAHRPPAGRHQDAPESSVPYIAGDELMEAVDLAIYLNRPLLLEGEAGSGKSQLAEYVADQLGLPLYRWLVRSTSSAEEGLYRYDAILRLHDVYVAQKGLSAQGKRDPEAPLDYVTYGALGDAFRLKECSAVVLIDEIDKADLDFPNDLLTVLDEPRRFTIREADNFPVEAEHPPIVIITSNKEKGNLPAPFLRRCIYYYIRFPADPARLEAIVAAHDAARASDAPRSGGSPPAARAEERRGASPPPGLVRAAVRRFLALREGRPAKPPGTSELLDWLNALTRKPLGKRELDALIERLGNHDARIPYPELLLKHREDWQPHAPAP